MLNLKSVIALLILVYGIYGIGKAAEFLNKIESKLYNKKDKKLEEEIKNLKKELKDMKEAKA